MHYPGLIYNRDDTGTIPNFLNFRVAALTALIITALKYLI